MKNLVILAVVFAVFSAQSIQASVDPIKPSIEKKSGKEGKKSLKNLLEANKVKEDKSLDEQVKDMLRNTKMDITEDARVMVKFMINSDNEIVVLDTECNSDRAAKMVRNYLNYNKVENVSAAQKNRFYYLAVALQAK